MAKLTPTHDQTILPIDSLAPPVRRYAAILSHSGGLPATQEEVDAPDLRTAHRLFWRLCIGSRFVREIYEQVDGAWKQVWKEGQPLPIDWRVLTLTPPWGSLIAAAESDDLLIGKRYETRPWQIGSYRGTILFHQGMGLAKYRESELERLIKQPPFLQTCRHLGYHRFSDLPRGAIVAVATLTNIFRTEEVRNSLSATERAFGNYEDRRFAWQLRDIVRLNPVIADVKGHRQLWTWTGAIPQLEGHSTYG